MGLKKGLSKVPVKQVLSKLREEGWGLRRFVWLLLVVFLVYRDWTLLDITKFVVCLALFLFIALPFVFKYTPWIQRHLVFLPFVKWPKNVDFNNPAAEGLPATRNFYLESEPGVNLGVWHILPQSAGDKERSQEMFEEEL